MPEPEPGAPDATPRAGRNLPVAIATGLLLAGLIFLTLFTARWAFLALVGICVLISQDELYGVLRKADLVPARALGLAAGGVLFIGAYQGGPSALAFGLTLSILACFAWYLVEPSRERVTPNVAATLLGLVYVPFLGAHVTMMRDLPHGPAVTIGYMGLVAFYDIGAFAAGSRFGKHPIAPRVSPKKTWEGAAGATILVFVLALLVGPMIRPFTVASAAGMAVIVCVLAPLGDLAESLIKRDLNVKDMGSILPGHGGLLDRIDALLLVAPAAYWFMRWALA